MKGKGVNVPLLFFKIIIINFGYYKNNNNLKIKSIIPIYDNIWEIVLYLINIIIKINRQIFFLFSRNFIIN